MSIIESASEDGSDPIDALIPRPRVAWRRLLAGVAIIAVVATASVLWGFGYLTPRPDCCGSGSAAALMSLSPDGEAVTTTAYFFNSSGRDLTVQSAQADLPGAEVLAVDVLHPDNSVYPTSDVLPFPTTTKGSDSTRFLITFVPTTCSDSTEGRWGTLTLDLDVRNGLLPSFGRSHDVAVVESAQDLAVLPPESVTDVPHTPLAAACALLGR